MQKQALDMTAFELQDAKQWKLNIPAPIQGLVTHINTRKNEKRKALDQTSKINFDSSPRDKSGPTGAKCVLQDLEGKSLMGGSQSLSFQTKDEAECEAFLPNW